MTNRNVIPSKAPVGRPLTPNEEKQRARVQANQSRRGQSGSRPINARKPERQPGPDVGGPDVRAQQEAVRATRGGGRVRAERLNALMEDAKGKEGEIVIGDKTFKDGKETNPGRIAQAKQAITDFLKNETRQAALDQSDASKHLPGSRTGNFLDDPSQFNRPATPSQPAFTALDRSRPFIPRGPAFDTEGITKGGLNVIPEGLPGRDTAFRKSDQFLSKFGGIPRTIEEGGIAQGSRLVGEGLRQLPGGDQFGGDNPLQAAGKTFNAAQKFLTTPIDFVAEKAGIPDNLLPGGLGRGIVRGFTGQESPREKRLKERGIDPGAGLLSPKRSEIEFQERPPTEQIGGLLPQAILEGGLEASARATRVAGRRALQQVAKDADNVTSFERGARQTGRQAQGERFARGVGEARLNNVPTPQTALESGRRLEAGAVGDLLDADGNLIQTIRKPGASYTPPVGTRQAFVDETLKASDTLAEAAAEARKGFDESGTSSRLLDEVGTKQTLSSKIYNTVFDPVLRRTKSNTTAAKSTKDVPLITNKFRQVSKSYRKLNDLVRGITLQSARRLKAFEFNADGGIATLTGNPTLPDVAADYARYGPLLSPEQRQTMEWFRDKSAWLNELYQQSGQKVKNRFDIKEGGFYLPRGSTIDVDQETDVFVNIFGTRRVGDPSSLKEASWPTMRVGMTEGAVYRPFIEAWDDALRAGGERHIDAVNANRVVRDAPEDAFALGGQTFPELRGGLQGTAWADEYSGAIFKELSRAEGVLSKSTQNDTLRNLLSIPRLTSTTWDNSVLGVQGWLGLADKQRAMKEGMKTSFQAWTNEDILATKLDDFNIDAAKQGTPTWEEFVEGGVRLNGDDGEYLLAGQDALGQQIQKSALQRGVERIPLVKRANRAFGFAGDMHRLTWARDLYIDEVMKKGANAPPPKEALSAISSIVNRLTGYSDDRALGNMGELLLFAPRFFMARLEVIAKAMDIRTIGTRGINTFESRYARKIMLRTVIGAALLTEMANWAMGQETDRNPLTKNGDFNTDFYTIRFNGRDWNLLGPYATMLGLIMATGITSASVAQSPTSLEDWDPALVNRIRSLASPAIGGLWDLISGTDSIGQPTRDNTEQTLETIGERFLPFSLSDAPKTQDDLKDVDWWSALTAIPGEAFGVRSSGLSAQDRKEEFLQNEGFVSPNLPFGSPKSFFGGSEPSAETRRDQFGPTTAPSQPTQTAPKAGAPATPTQGQNRIFAGSAIKNAPPWLQKYAESDPAVVRARGKRKGDEGQRVKTEKQDDFVALNTVLVNGINVFTLTGERKDLNDAKGRARNAYYSVQNITKGQKREIYRNVDFEGGFEIMNGWFDIIADPQYKLSNNVSDVGQVAARQAALEEYRATLSPEAQVFLLQNTNDNPIPHNVATMLRNKDGTGIGDNILRSYESRVDWMVERGQEDQVPGYKSWFWMEELTGVTEPNPLLAPGAQLNPLSQLIDEFTIKGTGPLGHKNRRGFTVDINGLPTSGQQLRTRQKKEADAARKSVSKLIPGRG